MTIKAEEINRECIVNAARTSMSSKLIGADSEFFSNLIVDAADLIKVSPDRCLGVDCFDNLTNCLFKAVKLLRVQAPTS